ncbi:hypothetical protein VP1G_11425 [Cytospora mali]|uniref:Uncharacterized protein n=1 Tax=Cytospora mali TaxID=578113 RepID=A0A194VFG4_CYTMA|nr:hypothetical protein VP1G_11425 [Valsa mali var. pyri (nom. inval.)]
MADGVSGKAHQLKPKYGNWSPELGEGRFGLIDVNNVVSSEECSDLRIVEQLGSKSGRISEPTVILIT